MPTHSTHPHRAAGLHGEIGCGDVHAAMRRNAVAQELAMSGQPTMVVITADYAGMPPDALDDLNASYVATMARRRR